MFMMPLVRWQCLSLHVTGVWELASHVSVGLARALSRKGSCSEDLAHDPGNQNCSDVPSSGGGGLGGRVRPWEESFTGPGAVGGTG